MCFALPFGTRVAARPPDAITVLGPQSLHGKRLRELAEANSPKLLLQKHLLLLQNHLLPLQNNLHLAH